MRIDVRKFLFIGHECDKEPFFKKAQEMGIIQFKEGFKGTPDVQLFIEAIKILEGIPTLEQKEEGDEHEIASKICHLQRQLEKPSLEVYGQFSLDDIQFLKERGVHLQFFCSKKKTSEDLIYIDSRHNLDYFISLNRAPTTYPGCVEIQLTGGTRQEIEAELKGMASYHQKLHTCLIEALNQAHLQEAKDQVVSKDSLFCIMGWVPQDKVKALKSLPVFVEEVAIEPHDTVPTHLENTKWSRVGEDLIGIYDTPSIQDKDPSLWVLFGFVLFFSMIIGDGGYGLVYLGIALYLRYKFPDLQGLKRRLLNLMTLLSIGCVIWGVLTASFFGMTLNPEISLTHYLAAHKGDSVDGVLLELALFVGVIHLILGQLRYLKKNPANIGWIAFLIGSYLYFPLFLGAPSLLNYYFGVPLESGGEVGLYLIGSGVATAIGIAVLRVGWAGLAEVMTVIQVFADALSYLRLYALALSGAILSATINGMASRMPLAIATVLIVIGHLINMTLGVMGGVIHGLRLNFLEWYHYSFEGGGRKFQPLKQIKD